MAVKTAWIDTATGKTGFTALSSDVLPLAAPGSLAWITDQPGTIKQCDGITWITAQSGGMALVSPPEAIPRIQVTPTVSGTSTAEVTLDAGTSNTMIGARITANPGDSVTAVTRLMNKYPDCVLASLEESVRITASSAITNISLVGVGDATNTAGNVISTSESTLSNVQSAMLEFAFDSADDVRVVEIKLSGGFTTGQKAQLQIAGYAS